MIPRPMIRIIDLICVRLPGHEAERKRKIYGIIPSEATAAGNDKTPKDTVSEIITANPDSY